MQLEFVPAASPEPAGKYTAGLISAQLHDGRSVLWLLSGGSAIAAAVVAARLLQEAAVDLSKLTVSLIDERFGPVGHADSNWAQLLAAGFELPEAQLQSVLAGADQAETADNFENFLASKFAATQYHVGLLGIGPDGHTSGILPHSAAVAAPGLVCAYDGGGYRRITTTPRALQKLDEAVVYAVGESKWSQLDRLETDLDIADQPAQSLKTLSKTTIFSDRPVSE